MLYSASIPITFTFFVLPSVALESFSNYTFAQFKHQFARSYLEGGDEYNARRVIFEDNLADILAHNAQGRSWKKGVNHLTDLSESEMKERLGYKPSWKPVPVENVALSSYLELTDKESSCMSQSQSCANTGSSCCSGLICGSQGFCVDMQEEKSSVDWAESSPTAYQVLEQGQCGSCWAVAASAAVQLHADIVSKNRFRKLLSPQSLLSCTPNEFSCGGEGGCRGATAELAFTWLASQGEKGGMLPLDMQAYHAVENAADCVAPSSHSFLQQQKRTPPPMISIKGFKNVEVNSAKAMMDALVNVGPVVASIVGGGLRSYSSGVIDECDNFIIDHAVVMMGYGTDNTLSDMAYWKVRNSWGPNWGERGHFRLQRFQPTGKEPCGYDTDPSKGVACKDTKGPDGKYPEQQWFCGSCGILSDTAYPFGTHVPEALLEKSL